MTTLHSDINEAPAVAPALSTKRMSDRDLSSITISRPPSPRDVDGFVAISPSSPSSTTTFDASEVSSRAFQDEKEPARRTSCLCDEHVRFLVDGKHFTVHKSIFDPTSDETRHIIASRMDGIIALEDVTVVDFERFLSAMRCKICDEPPLSTQEDWTSVLKLSYRFGHAAMRAFAIKRLDPLTSCIDRIVLAHQFEVAAWLPQAYVDVCDLGRLPSMENAHRLGFDVFIKIAAAREAFRLSSDVVEASRRAAIVKDIFDLPSTHFPECKPDTPVSSEEAANIPRSLNPAASPFVAAFAHPKAETLPLPKKALSSPSIPILELSCPKPAADVPRSFETFDPSSSMAAGVEAEVTESPKKRPSPRSRGKLPTPVVESPNASAPAPNPAEGLVEVIPPASTSRTPSHLQDPAILRAGSVLRSLLGDYSVAETSCTHPPPPPLERTQATGVRRRPPPPRVCRGIDDLDTEHYAQAIDTEDYMTRARDHNEAHRRAEQRNIDR